MKSLVAVMLSLLYLSAGCAVFSEQYKKDEYDRTIYAYETALQLSDFHAICQLVDPAAMSKKACLECFGDNKVASYKLTGMTISEDRQKVHQEIEVEYYPNDNIVLKRIQFSQSWAYRPDSKKWILENGPPDFK
jgi:hypothetical protein